MKHVVDTGPVPIGTRRNLSAPLGPVNDLAGSPRGPSIPPADSPPATSECGLGKSESGLGQPRNGPAHSGGGARPGICGSFVGGGSMPGAGARPGVLGTSSWVGGIGGIARPRRLRRGGSNITRMPSTADSAAFGATSDQLPPSRRAGTSFSWVALPIAVPSKITTDQSMRTRLRPAIGGAVVTRPSRM